MSAWHHVICYRIKRGPDKEAWQHPFFHRGDTSQLQLICRTAVKGKRSRRGSDRSTYSGDESQVEAKTKESTVMTAGGGIIDGPTKTSTNVRSNGIICDTIGLQPSYHQLVIAGHSKTITNFGSNGIICNTVGSQTQQQQVRDGGFISGPAKTPSNFSSSDITLNTVGPQAQQQQQPLMYHNHQPLSMANSQSLLLTNSSLSQPFNNNQVMAMMASVLSGSLPRNDDLNYSVASLGNNYESLNLNNLTELSKECASSLMAKSDLSHPCNNQIMAMMPSTLTGLRQKNNDFNSSSMKNNNETSDLNSLSALLEECAASRRSTEIILQMTEAESAAARSARCESESQPPPDVAITTRDVSVNAWFGQSESQPPLDLAITTRDVSVNTWLGLNRNIGIGDDHFVVGHGVLETTATTTAKAKPCEKSNHKAQSNTDFETCDVSHFTSE